MSALWGQKVKSKAQMKTNLKEIKVHKIILYFSFVLMSNELIFPKEFYTVLKTLHSPRKLIQSPYNGRVTCVRELVLCARNRHLQCCLLDPCFHQCPHRM